MSQTDATQMFIADVIQVTVNDHSIVVGSGGGYYDAPISIFTHHQRITEMWVRLTDGREVRLGISGDFPVRTGHRIACLTSSSCILPARTARFP
ncbi:hypothetical protein OH491_15385 [Termitidicoccus mucosus]|uniref:Uncharacterized protein n=1 Tax=Termitidicoccus mucosus TaxID=1184151 RepID=A0A178IRS3_9BACT|nr:hypothetical protein AW736_26140 [Opitutaceae bacterium TSB47]